MPQKTKKQKQKSSQNRHIRESVIEQPHMPHPEHVHASPSVFSFSSNASRTLKNQQSDIASDTFHYLRHDLLKTVILAIICCGTLIGLSFVLK